MGPRRSTNPTRDLNIGDAVYTRVFDQSGENASYSTRPEPVIENNEQGKANNWSMHWHQRSTKSRRNRAGRRNDQGDFAPCIRLKSSLLKAGSGFKSVEIGQDWIIQSQMLRSEATALESEYIIDESQPTQLDLTLAATGIRCSARTCRIQPPS
ncbi:hypothetical protein OH492_16170 [Vibrio chagasii]|nr:hypothetical protein [Vibrio chagasii]